MHNARVTVPTPLNEPVLSYAPGSSEKTAIKAQLDAFGTSSVEIPLVIGGRDVATGDVGTCIVPHDHQRQLATYHRGNAETVHQATAAAAAARPEWSAMPWESRAAIFLKAAELLAGRYRQVLNAATMLNQSKTAFQAEIDAACELIDFWRFNVSYLPEIYEQQPQSAPGIWNVVEYRALEGFVFAVTPFNFTSIAGNLPTSPALMGNTVVWKPASTAVFSAYWLMQLLEEAGLPPGVINLVPGGARRLATRRWRTRTWLEFISPAVPRYFKACGARWVPTSPDTRAIPASSVRPAARTLCSPTRRRTRRNWRRI